ncbi:MAG TPA: ATP-binding cassette domain-containing protein [Anaerolineae bacterium]
MEPSELTSNEFVVETRELTKVYGDGGQVRALDAVDLTVGRGEFIAIVGPSGSGKSTLLNLIGALDQPTRMARFNAIFRFTTHSIAICTT